MLNKLKQTSDYYFLACMTFVLGLFMQDFFKLPLTGGIIFLGLSWIFTFQYKQKLHHLFSKPFAIAFIGLYFLHLFSMIYTENYSDGWNDIRLKITLFLLPLFMLSVNMFTQVRRWYLLKFFTVLMALMASVDITISLLEFLKSLDISVFYYKQLPHVLTSKPHYVSWHYTIALFIAFHQIAEKNERKGVWIATSVILLVSLLLLSSRIYLIAFILVFIISFFKWATHKNVSKLLWAKMALGLFGLVLLLIFNPKTNSRISDTKVEIQKLLGADTHRETNPRVYLWKYAIDVIADKPILGYGVGDAKDELNKALEDCDAKFWNGEKNIPIHSKNLNYHNQFLQTWAEVGILGFLLLLFLMLRPFFLKNQHPLFLIFVGLTLIGFLTESMLERQAGVVLFAFMYPLLSSLKVQSTPE